MNTETSIYVHLKVKLEVFTCRTLAEAGSKE